MWAKEKFLMQRIRNIILNQCNINCTQYVHLMGNAKCKTIARKQQHIIVIYLFRDSPKTENTYYYAEH
jgi:hypothetical protein